MKKTLVRRCLSFPMVVALATAGAVSAQENDSASYFDEIRQWRADRVARLTSEDGWLTLVGLHWLSEGPNTIGTASDKDIQLPSGSAPDDIGTITVEGNRAWIDANPAADVRSKGQKVDRLDLADDQSGEPTLLEIGDLRGYLISRGGRYALRVKDPQSYASRNFSGIDHYETSESWKFQARFEAYDPPRTLPVPTVVDDTLQDMMSPGAVVFDVDGQSYRIEAQAESADAPLFLIFGDRTNGRGTYGGGRYLYTEPPAADGTVEVDFNKTYNPPCAYTSFATCPLPPRQNRLAVAIEAGEKYTSKSPPR